MGAPVATFGTSELPYISVTSYPAAATATTLDALSSLAGAVGYVSAPFISFSLITEAIFGTFEAAMAAYQASYVGWLREDPVAATIWVNEQRIAEMQAELNAEIPAQAKPAIQTAMNDLQWQNEQLLASQKTAAQIVASAAKITELPIQGVGITAQEAAQLAYPGGLPGIELAADAIPATWVTGAQAVAAGTTPASISRTAARVLSVTGAATAAIRSVAAARTALSGQPAAATVPVTSGQDALSTMLQENPWWFLLLLAGGIWLIWKVIH